MSERGKRGRGNSNLKESGAVRKSWRGRISVALVYPNTYYVGMSNLGFQTVYGLFNTFDDIVCERAFSPDRKDGPEESVRTVESGRQLREFDVVAFSISFENDYLHILTILDKAGLPLFSSERCPPDPLIIAGGVTSLLNPEPLAPFVDCFLIGDAEASIPSFLECLRKYSGKEAQLVALARQGIGAYIPSFYQTTYKSNGTIDTFRPKTGRHIPDKIQSAFARDLEEFDTHTKIVTSQTTFGNTFLIEGARGCPHGCRFCAAGYVYRPPRFRKAEQLEMVVNKVGGQAKGVGLVAAAVADIPSLESFCHKTTNRHLDLSFSSLRADMLTETLLGSLKKAGTKTVTIAPDAGSERLRRVINKGMNEKDILDAVNKLVHTGIPNIKLYFMIGLPTETDKDVLAIVQLCKRIKHQFLKASRAQSRIGDIVVSISSFVPKPFTPFQWAPMEDVGVLKSKIKSIKDGLKRVPNIKVHTDVPRWAYIQALLSRGDRRIASLLETVHRNNGNWAQSLKESIVNTDFFVYRHRDFGEVLPWDFVDHGVKKRFLKEEYEKALAGKTTDGCLLGTCKICGACD